ncbi:MAG: hypothetical protein QM504_14515 [Pseudomonadota bacterium]
MAFQGKGILGSVRGKIGNLVGYNRNGKNVLQSIGNRKGNASRLTWDYINQLLINPFNATVGNYYVTNNSFSNTFSHGARSKLPLQKGQGGLEFKIGSTSMQSFIGFSPESVDYKRSLAKTTILILGTGYRIYIDNMVIRTGSGLVLGAKFRIVIGLESTKYFLDNNQGEFVLIYETVIVYTYPLYMLTMMANAGDIFVDLKMGGYHLK